MKVVNIKTIIQSMLKLLDNSNKPRTYANDGLAFQILAQIDFDRKLNYRDLVELKVRTPALC